MGIAKIEPLESVAPIKEYCGPLVFKVLPPCVCFK